MDTSPPALLSLACMVELFDVKKQTVYRWNTASAGRPKLLPDPLVVVGRTPLWAEDTIVSWAEGRGLRVDRVALRRIRRQQEAKPGVAVTA